MYEIRFMKAAERFLKKIKEKNLKAAFLVALKKIADDPYMGELKTGDLAGIYCYDVFYNHTNYEVAYQIFEEKDRLVIVLLAGTRENFYEELKRYIK